MKILISNLDWMVSPKQVEGKLLPKYTVFTVKPKSGGVVLKRHDRAYVLKMDARFGIVLRRVLDNRILERYD